MKLFFRKNNNLSDEELFERFTNGSKTAFDELYKRYAPKLHYYFFKMLNRDAIKAEDFTQDAFMKIIKKPELFDKSRRFSTWIFSIAYNQCKDEYKKMSQRTFEYPDFEDFSGMNKDSTYFLDKAALNIRLDEEMNKLNEDQKTAVILKYQENYSIKDIAELMNCSEGTVKSRLFYGISKLSKNLKEFDLKESTN